MVCYRRHGHNEGDDPSYTQPLMYQAIDSHRSVRKLFTEALVKRGDITLDEAEAALDDFQQRLQQALDETRSAAPPPGGGGSPAGARSACCPTSRPASTAATLDAIFDHFTDYPEGFTPHPKLARQFEARSKLYHEQGEVEWATAELLAFGSLVLEGTASASPARTAAGARSASATPASSTTRPARRGCPIATLPGKQAKFWVYDSLLSEYAARRLRVRLLGRPTRTPSTLWEAQFGDFINGAQIIIDQYLVAAEDKWGQTAGLVMLLPHGYEGQGPEHSLGPHRALPHAGRRGQHPGRQRHHGGAVLPPPAPPDAAARCASRSWSSRRRATCAGPRAARRSTSWPHGSFQEVLDDPGVDRSATRSDAAGVLLGQGGLRRHRPAGTSSGAAGGRHPGRAAVPVPAGADARACSARYPNAKELVWLQEEPTNMGPWHFMFHRAHPIRERGYTLRCVARVESGSPATGSAKIHEQEQQELLDEAFDGL